MLVPSSLLGVGMTDPQKHVVIDIRGELKVVSEGYELSPGEVYVEIDDGLLQGEPLSQHSGLELSGLELKENSDHASAKISDNQGSSFIHDLVQPGGFGSDLQEKMLIIDIAGNVKVVPIDT